MPGLYLYAVTDAPLAGGRRSGPVLKGIFGRPLRTVAAGGAYAVVEVASRAPKPSVRRLEAQDAVLRSLASCGAVMLPARFGSFVRHVGELRQILDERRSALARALRQAAGCAQMTVRIVLNPPPRVRRATQEASGGAAYLRALLAEHRARRAHPVVRAVRTAGRGLVRAERIEWLESQPNAGTRSRPGPRPEGASRAIVSVYHLVPRRGLQAYLRKLAVVARRADARLIVSGPFLPFAFTGESE